MTPPIEAVLVKPFRIWVSEFSSFPIQASKVPISQSNQASLGCYKHHGGNRDTTTQKLKEQLSMSWCLDPGYLPQPQRSPVSLFTDQTCCCLRGIRQMVLMLQLMCLGLRFVYDMISLIRSDTYIRYINSLQVNLYLYFLVMCVHLPLCSL